MNIGDKVQHVRWKNLVGIVTSKEVGSNNEQLIWVRFEGETSDMVVLADEFMVVRS